MWNDRAECVKSGFKGINIGKNVKTEKDKMNVDKMIDKDML